MNRWDWVGINRGDALRIVGGRDDELSLSEWSCPRRECDSGMDILRIVKMYSLTSTESECRMSLDQTPNLLRPDARRSRSTTPSLTYSDDPAIEKQPRP